MRCPAAGAATPARPASLISLWATAPFLLNNSVGEFEESPSVESQMKSFDNSIEQMLWPEKRLGNISYVTASGKTLRGHGHPSPATATAIVVLCTSSPT
jgi:hypothetical protein